jgi:hypothetical protein
LSAVGWWHQRDVTTSALIRSAVIVATLSCVGCGSPDGPSRAASQSATTFYAALDASDGPGACAQLTEKAAHEVEKSSSSACPDGVLDEVLAPPGAVVSVDVYGTEAQVELEHDTVFVTYQHDGWRVAAAGCQPSPGEPFDCTIQGA